METQTAQLASFPCKAIRFSKGEVTYFVPFLKNNCLDPSKAATRILNCQVLSVMNPAP